MVALLVMLVGLVAGQSGLLRLQGEGSMLIFNTQAGPFTLSSIGDMTLQANGTEAFRFASCGNTCQSFSSRDLTLSSNLLGSSSSAFTISSVPQWKLVALEDFQGIVSGWSRSDISNCGNSPNLFLGGYCRFAGTSTSKAFTLPMHAQVRVKFNVHFIDRWDGESVAARLDGLVHWTQSHSTCPNVLTFTCTQYGLSMCGGDYPDKLAQAVEFVSTHTAPTATLEFMSNSGRNSCDGSWGIDDVEIYVR